MKTTICCGAEADTDLMICSECKEHLGDEDIETGEETPKRNREEIKAELSKLIEQRVNGISEHDKMILVFEIESMIIDIRYNAFMKGINSLTNKLLGDKK